MYFIYSFKHLFYLILLYLRHTKQDLHIGEIVIVKISNGTALIDAGGAKREVSSQLLEDLEPGDYVMVHAGVAIAKITDEDDSETEQLMEEFL